MWGLISEGKLSGGVNKEGVKYYNNLINELLSKGQDSILKFLHIYVINLFYFYNSRFIFLLSNAGLTPFVTIFHWDLPQALEDDYGGFLSPHVV